jgi:hypothetical protein
LLKSPFFHAALFPGAQGFMHEQACCAHEPPSDEGWEMMHRGLQRSAASLYSYAFYIIRIPRQ